MPPQIKQAKLREEFRTFFKKEAVGNDLVIDWVADFWLAKLDQTKLETLESIIKEVGGNKRYNAYLDGGTLQERDNYFYNLALSDLLTKLQADLTLMKNEK